MKNTKILASAVIALASMAAGSAFADSDSDMPYPVVASTQSTVSRAQVKAELAQAQKDGTWSSASDDYNYPVIANVGTPKTRADVRAELIKAQKDHSIPAYHG